MASPLLSANRPTPKKIADELLQRLPVFDALELFTLWGDKHRIDCEILGLDGSEYTEKIITDTFSKALKEKTEREAKTEKPSAMTEEELMAMDLPPIEWIINKVIPKGGLVAISGRPGSFKSYFALWLARRIAAGEPIFCDDDLDQPFFCEQKTAKTGVLFIEEENSQIMTRERLRGFRVPSSANLHLRVMQGFKVQDDVWQKNLLEDVKNHNIGVIIMDPFSSVMGLKDENDNAEVSGVMDLLRKEFLEKGVTIIFLHHPSKGDTGAAGLRGAGDILGKVDVHLLMERDEIDKRTAKVSFAKMRLISEEEVQSFKIRLSGDKLAHDERFRYLGSAETKHEETKRKILETMIIGEEFTRAEVADTMGVASGTYPFNPAWKSLIADKKIYKALGSRKFISKGTE